MSVKRARSCSFWQCQFRLVYATPMCPPTVYTVYVTARDKSPMPSHKWPGNEAKFGVSICHTQLNATYLTTGAPPPPPPPPLPVSRPKAQTLQKAISEDQPPKLRPTPAPASAPAPAGSGPFGFDPTAVKLRSTGSKFASTLPRQGSGPSSPPADMRKNSLTRNDSVTSTGSDRSKPSPQVATKPIRNRDGSVSYKNRPNQSPGISGHPPAIPSPPAPPSPGKPHPPSLLHASRAYHTHTHTHTHVHTHTRRTRRCSAPASSPTSNGIFQ